MADREIAFLLAPGAGAPSSHPRMQIFARLLGSLGAVEAFDYPYMQEGRKRPDPLPKLIAAHQSALASLRKRHAGPIVLAGKSMGGRVGCHVALTDEVQALVCLGYPLCGGGDRSKLRDQVLLELRTPVMFVEGTRDPLCPLDLLAEIRSRMQTSSDLHVVDGGDHSLLVSKTALKARATQDEVDEKIMKAIADFLNRYLPATA
jgi:predicted alpha/beta-hydrolase family hydrolase